MSTAKTNPAKSQEDTPKSSTPQAASSQSSNHLAAIWEAANIYGARSFDNYAQIRSVAETLRDQFSLWLDPASTQKARVFLVPPEGPFLAQNYQSGAFSVSGAGYLPLEPINFGLAVQISEDKDYMRLVMHCSKEGDAMLVAIGDKRAHKLPLPIVEKDLPTLFEQIQRHILDFFQDSVDEYDNGDYGNPSIGFDIARQTE